MKKKHNCEISCQTTVNYYQSCVNTAKFSEIMLYTHTHRGHIAYRHCSNKYSLTVQLHTYAQLRNNDY